MWNKRQDQFQSPAAPPPPSPAEPVKEGVRLSTLSQRNSEPEVHRGTATMGKSVSVKGQIISLEDLLIDGQVEGTIELHENRLTVGPNGRVQATIKGREVVIMGTVHGNVEATDKIDIRKDARLIGDIKTARIVIEDGAYFKGSIDIVKQEIPKPPPPPAPRPQPAATTVPAVSAPAISVPAQTQTVSR